MLLAVAVMPDAVVVADRKPPDGFRNRCGACFANICMVALIACAQSLMIAVVFPRLSCEGALSAVRRLVIPEKFNAPRSASSEIVNAYTASAAASSCGGLLFAR